MIIPILEKIETYLNDESYSFFIMEPADLPCFLQFAKIGEEFILDVPKSNFYNPGMDTELYELLKMKYNKSASTVDEDGRVMSYQIRFTKAESNKMCYIVKDIFHSILSVDEDSDLIIIMR